MGHWMSQILYVTAKLGLADHLGRGRKTADELAGATRTDAPSLFRLMPTLAHLGILEQDPTNHFALTPLGEALRTGALGSARGTILTVASDWWSRGFGELLYSLACRYAPIPVPGNGPGER
jgi:DNA-binding IclR family transcriptional regulator